MTLKFATNATETKELSPISISSASSHENSSFCSGNNNDNNTYHPYPLHLSEEDEMSALTNQTDTAWRKVLLTPPIIERCLEFPSSSSIEYFDDDVSSWGDDNGELLRSFEHEGEQGHLAKHTSLTGMVISIPSMTPAMWDIVAKEDIFESLEHVAVTDTFSNCNNLARSSIDVNISNQTSDSSSIILPCSLSTIKRKNCDGSIWIDSFSDDSSVSCNSFGREVFDWELEPKFTKRARITT